MIWVTVTLALLILALGTVSDVFTLAVAATGANKSAVVSMTWIEQR
jgi:hypothetical protein